MNKATKRKADPYEDFDDEGKCPSGASLCWARPAAVECPTRVAAWARVRAHRPLRLLPTYDEADMAVYRLGGRIIACYDAKGLVAKVV